MNQPEMFEQAKARIVEPFTTEEAWHARRRHCVGASEVAALFGCHPYLTANHLYHIKRGTAVDERRSDKALRNFGNVMEPIIAQLVADKTGWKLDPLAIQEHHIHPQHTGLGCTVDRFIVESERGKGILEIKNVSAFSPGWSETRAPDYIEYQMQHQLLVEVPVSGVTWGCIGAMIGGNPDDIRIMVREPDPKVAKAIVERSTQFWDMVKAGKEPPITGDDFDHIAEMFKAAEPRREEEVRREDLDFEGLVMAFEEAKAKTKEAEFEEAEAKAKLLRACMIEGADGMERDIAVLTENRAVEFKVIDVKESVSVRKAGKQLRINIKEKKAGQGE